MACVAASSGSRMYAVASYKNSLTSRSSMIGGASSAQLRLGEAAALDSGGTRVARVERANWPLYKPAIARAADSVVVFPRPLVLGTEPVEPDKDKSAFLWSRFIWISCGIFNESRGAREPTTATDFITGVGDRSFLGVTAPCNDWNATGGDDGQSFACPPRRAVLLLRARPKLGPAYECWSSSILAPPTGQSSNSSSDDELSPPSLTLVTRSCERK